MRVARQMGRRLVAVTSLIFVVGVFVVILVVRYETRNQSADRLAELIADAVPEAAVTECRRGSPARVMLDAGVELHFYDAEGNALSGGAPLIHRALFEKVSAGHRSAGTFEGRALQSLAVVRLPDAGSCAFAQARWRHDSRSVRPVLVSTSLSVAAIAGLLAVLVSIFVVAPLLARLRELRRASGAVGTDAFAPAPDWNDEAGEIARALNAAHVRLVENARRLEDRGASLEWILSEVGHDVRTPLASLQFALDELADATPPTALPTLRRALSDVVYLQSLTSNLRFASRVQRDDWERLPIEARVCLSDVVERAAARAAPFALRRGIDLVSSIAPGLHATGDETGGERALTNLLENAIAHSAPGTTVTIVVEASDSTIRVVVEDDGPGVAPEVLPRLGSRAFRSEDARARDGRGTGLGLAITREICERSGWTVRFERVEPRGLRAILEAPLR